MRFRSTVKLGLLLGAVLMCTLPAFPAQHTLPTVASAFLATAALPSPTELSNCVVDGKDLCRPQVIVKVKVTPIDQESLCELLTTTTCLGTSVTKTPTPDDRTMYDPTPFS